MRVFSRLPAVRVRIKVLVILRVCYLLITVCFDVVPFICLLPVVRSRLEAYYKVFVVRVIYITFS